MSWAAPLILVFGIKWLLLGRDHGALILSAALLTAVVSAKGWYWLFYLFGVHAGQGAADFVTLAGIARTAGLFGLGVLDLFNANIFGRAVFSVRSLSVELNFLILIATLLSPLLLLSRWVRRDVWRVFLVLQPAFIAIAFIGGGMAFDTYSARYLVMLPFYAALIWAVVLTGPLAPRPRLVVGGVLVLATLLNVASTVQEGYSRSLN